MNTRSLPRLYDFVSNTAGLIITSFITCLFTKHWVFPTLNDELQASMTFQFVIKVHMQGY